MNPPLRPQAEYSEWSSPSSAAARRRPTVGVVEPRVVPKMNATTNGNNRKEQKEQPNPTLPPTPPSNVARNNEGNFFKQFEQTRQTSTAPGGAAPSGTVPDGYCITEKLPLHFKEALRRTRVVRGAAAAAEGAGKSLGDSLKVKTRQMGAAAARRDECDGGRVNKMRRRKNKKQLKMKRKRMKYSGGGHSLSSSSSSSSSSTSHSDYTTSEDDDGRSPLAGQAGIVFNRLCLQIQVRN